MDANLDVDADADVGVGVDLDVDVGERSKKHIPGGRRQEE